MTFDFRASQVRTSKIILSGSATGSGARLLIYPIESQGSPLNQGNLDPNLFSTGSIGQDVLMYISGVIGGVNGTSHGVVVLGGDLFCSGGIRTEQDVRASNIYAGTLVDSYDVQGVQYFGNSAPEFNFFVTGFRGRFNVTSSVVGGIANFRSQGNIAMSEGTAFSGTLSCSLTANRIWQIPDASGDVTLTNRVLAGSNITINTYTGGYVGITGSAGSGGFATLYQFVAGYTTTLVTDPGVVCGQIAYVPAEISSSNIILRTVLSTTTGSNTVYVQLYNHTSGSYVCIGGSTNTMLSSSAVVPTVVQSVNLTGATNWTTGSAVYELQMFTSSSSYLAKLGSAQFVCT